MQKKSLNTFTEESVLFVSIFKWIILATIIGALVGSAATLFLMILESSTLFTSQFSHYYLFLPIILVITTLITHYIAPDSQGHGTEKVIRSVHKNQGNIRLRIVPVKLFTTISTLAFGGSVGKEGPCAQIGAALASGFSKLFRFNVEDRKKLVICGISAGFSAVFGTPIAGAIFGVEVLFVGNLLYSVLLPSFISGMVSYQIAHVMGVEYHYYFMNISQVFDLKLFLLVVLSGIFFGLICVLFIELLSFIEQRTHAIKCSSSIKALGGGVFIAAVALFISTDYLGLGLDVIDRALAGGSIIWYAFLLKIIMSAVTLAAGGSGGILTPIFFVGATSGVLFADFFGLDRAIFAAIGMISVLGGSANTPLAACVLAIELFGSAIAPYATVACVISFFMTGYRSIFPSQVLSSMKTPSILMKKGEEVEHFTTHYDYKTRKIMASGRQYAKRVLRKKHLRS